MFEYINNFKIQNISVIIQLHTDKEQLYLVGFVFFCKERRKEGKSPLFQLPIGHLGNTG